MREVQELADWLGKLSQEVDYEEWIPKLQKASQYLQMLTMMDEDFGCVLIVDHKPFLYCSDTFQFATADGERFEPEDVPLLHKLFTQWGLSGINAWIANKRNEEPLVQMQDADYFAARDWLKARQEREHE